MDRKTRNRERFVSLAEKRVSRTIKDLRLIGNLSNRSNYSYSERDIEAIIRTLQRELNRTKERFYANTKGTNQTFKL